MKNNIILIGMPGVGKSTVGVVLAKMLGYHFVDTDLVIQNKTGKLLKDIIDEVGTEGFIEVENRINMEIEAEKSVISPGGSVIYGEEAMLHYKDIGKIVYLKAPYEVIESRISNLEGRGVVLKKGQTLKELYDERSLLYEKYADITIDETGLGIAKTAAAIASAVKSR